MRIGHSLHWAPDASSGSAQAHTSDTTLVSSPHRGGDGTVKAATTAEVIGMVRERRDLVEDVGSSLNPRSDNYQKPSTPSIQEWPIQMPTHWPSALLRREHSDIYTGGPVERN
jgi:hypothetical protein